MKSMAGKHRRLVVGLMGLWFGGVMLATASVARAAAAQNQSPTAPSLKERMIQPITYSCTELPVHLMLMQLTEIAGVDFIKSSKVEGNVTAKVTNIPLEEALSNILAAHGWGYVQTRNMIRVLTLEEIVEEQKRKAEEEALKKAVPPEIFVTKIYRVNYADTKEVAKALEKFISKKGAITVIHGTSNIMVTETESRISAIDDFMKEIDRITPQILVEARIYDITHKDQLDLGVEWALGRNTVFDEDGNPIGGRLDPYIVGGFSGGENFAETAQGTFRFGILRDAFNLDAVIRAQQDIVDAELVANPRIKVLDNETANIEAVREIPYTEESRYATGGALTSTRFKEVGVKLEVTPHVTSEGLIRLEVKPEFGVVVRLPEDGPPTVDTRKTTTVLLVKDGQTVVMGGLRKKETRESVRKIPVLGDVPILGLLFRSEGEETVNNELVVFITPSIVRTAVLTDSEAWNLQQTEIEFPKSAPLVKELPEVPELERVPQRIISLPPYEANGRDRRKFIPR